MIMGLQSLQIQTDLCQASCILACDQQHLEPCLHADQVYPIRHSWQETISKRLNCEAVVQKRNVVTVLHQQTP